MEKTYGRMTMEIDLPNDRAIRLIGTDAQYWIGEGLPVYEGPISGLPSAVIDELLELQAIKPN